MKRISVDEVRAAYAVTGLEPVRNTGLYLDHLSSGQGCPVDALFRHRSKRTSASAAFIADVLGVSEDYLYGFVCGVDATDQVISGTDVACGYADGRAVANAIFGEAVAS